MDFYELLEKRRSIRDFEDKEVPLELIEELIKDSVKAPNAGNMQLWRFVIVNNKEWVKKLSDANKKAMISDIEGNPNSPFKGYEARIRDENYNVFYNAPCVIYLAGSARAGTLSVDCALLASYFMLLAAAKGLGTCWVAQGAQIKDPEILAELGIPENYRIIAPIILGYPRSIPPMPERKEPKILKVIS
ncbi:MAG: nitroreductase family protein [Deltaproteobacteria bacterium]|nr:nitroreductase family protein [Deltaproteobacteria bacterium]MBW2051922.1 nitroreductase family protein [Deltaproteobacteria bacterium]MBW2140329.1 nitroreductase family protein [Deltaproteobacteria bacterium]MBW2324136.1 nitroreductase family protein [Deltaproteobacteria bacterium]